MLILIFDERIRFKVKSYKWILSLPFEDTEHFHHFVILERMDKERETCFNKTEKESWHFHQIFHVSKIISFQDLKLC